MDSDQVAEMEESQRALELRKFFAPFDPALALEDQNFRGFNASIRGDGALCAFAETVLWRLRGTRAMVSLIDKTTQYFLAGVERGSRDAVTLDAGSWFGCDTVATPGGLCENTIAVNGSSDDYPCFQVEDLSMDPRFANLPVVDGSIEAYRFYAGAPIVTENGTRIGSLFIFDTKPRPSGLSYEERKWLNQSAKNAMRVLEMKREAAERRRAALMSKGIAKFLELTSNETEDYENDLDTTLPSHVVSRSHSPTIRPDSADKTADDEEETTAKILDKIKMTLDHAAKILRESLEIFNGGIVFLDTSLGYSESGTPEDYFSASSNLETGLEDSTPGEGKNSVSGPLIIQSLTSIGSLARGGISPGQVRSFHDQHRPAKVLAMSATAWTPGSNIVDGKTLQLFISNYPKGNVWYIDDKGFFCSFEQVNELHQIENKPSSFDRRRSVSGSLNLNRQKIEAQFLSRVFPKSRQIIFLPQWDVAGKRWYSGCFVWSQAAVPVFTPDSDIAYLSAFTNSVMVEISRLDAITANKMKSNFISSISHEFRSPLHGILASSDFLRETHLDSTQAEFISTIQNCGSTLLDTINHVLEYSKINSFKTKSDDGVESSSGLYEACNVALLCEEIVSGMMAAEDFKDSDSNPLERLEFKDKDSVLDIILDFENRDWNYQVQPGALRRILLNLFGNAYKFTNSGFIHVRLRVRNPGSPGRQSLVMNIMDSGIGMSTDYMQRNLYTPFAQEDVFSTGVGLGLSIVWSIVTQLKGKVHIRSEKGKGTDVEVVLPLSDVGDILFQSERADTAIAAALEAQDCITKLKEVAKDMTTALWWQTSANGTPSADEPSRRNASQNLADHCIETYLRDWFGFTIIPFSGPPFASADILLQPHDRYEPSVSENETQQLVLLLRDRISRSNQKKYQNKTAHNRSLTNEQNVSLGSGPQIIRTIYRPLGPYKLAAALSALLNEAGQSKAKLAFGFPQDAGIDANVAEPINTTVPPIPISLTTTTPAGAMSPQTVDLPVRSSPTDLPVQPNSKTIDFAVETPILPTNPPLSVSNMPLKTPQLGLNILAVDDNNLNLALLHRYLVKRRNNALDRVVLAKNGIEAVEAYKNGGSEITTGTEAAFDVIFMDISMPLMDGFEATRRIRRMERAAEVGMASDLRADLAAKPNHDPDESYSVSNVPQGEFLQNRNTDITTAIPNSPTISFLKNKFQTPRKRAYIAALTGLASRRDREEAVQCGVDEFLTKPVGFARVGEILGRVAEEKATRRIEVR